MKRHVVMKGYLKWILVLTMSLFSALAMQAQQKSDVMKVEQWTEQFQKLDQLYRNGFRTIKEYDTTNDSSTDTLLWSPSKTQTEVRSILEDLLSQRGTLAKEGSKELAYQSRVQRWGLTLSPEQTIYVNLLGVTSQFADQYPELRKLQATELEKALEEHLSAEGLTILRHLLSNQDSDSQLSMIDSYLSRFKEEEQLYLRAYRLLVLFREKVYPIQEKISFDSDRKYDAEWRKALAPIERELDKLAPMIGTSPYSREIGAMQNEILTDQISEIEVKNVDVASGEVTLQVFGILRSDATLYRYPSGVRFHTNGIKEGRYMGVASIKGGQIVRVVLRDQLPKVGYYHYVGVKSQDLTRMAYSSVRYEQIFATSYDASPTTIRVCVLNRVDGKPIPGVTITKRNMKGQDIASARTNAEGFADFPKAREPYYVVIKDGRMSDEASFFIPALDRDPAPYEKDLIEYYTDRPIYRRGQVVQFGIVTYNLSSRGNRTLGEKKVEIKLVANRGAERVELASQMVTTNAEGVAQLEVTLPDDAGLSSFRLESDWGNHWLEVQDYKLSYLDIHIDSIPSGYVEKQPLVVYGRTTDLNGLPTAATIQMEYDRGKKIQVTSGADGRFKFETPLVSPLEVSRRRYWRPYTTIDFTASDALGNVAHYSLPISKDSTDLPLSAEAAILGSTIDKREVILDTSTQPYLKKYLADLKNRKVYAELIASDGSKTSLGVLAIDGKTTFSLPQLKSGAYQLRLFATDGYGKQTESLSEPIYLYSPSDRVLYGEHLIWTAKLSERSILVGSSEAITAMLLLYRPNGVATHRFIDLKAGVLQELDLHDAVSVQVSVVKDMTTSSESIELKSMEVEQKSLEIALSLKEKYLPGSDFSEVIKVRGRDGKPLQHTPIFVTVFDKAVADAGYSDFWSYLKRNHYELVDHYYSAFDYSSVTLESAPMRAVATAKGMNETEEIALASDAPSGLEGIELRRNFVETAYFSVLLLTDDKGEVQLSFKMPDTQTQYLTKVFTFTNDLEEELIQDFTFEVYNPLSIELSTPRFLTWDDTLEGEALIRNSGDTALSGRYEIATSDGLVLSSDAFRVEPQSSVAVPFTYKVVEGEEVKLQGRVTAGELSDGVERVIPLRSNLSEYIVAQPISVFQQKQITLTLPKSEIATSNLTIELYLDPIQLLLSKLAQEHKRYDKIEQLGLFGALHYYVTYSRLSAYLEENLAFVEELQKAILLLSGVASKESNWTDRIADPQTLAAFYTFITDKEKLSSRLSQLERTIESHAVGSGGFRYSNYFSAASPWLTAYILDALAEVQSGIQSSTLKSHLPKSMTFLKSELQRGDSWYRDYIGFALLVSKYDPTIKSEKELLEQFDSDTEEEFTQSLNAMKENYQRYDTSALLRFGRYTRAFGNTAEKESVEQFISARSGYTLSDREKLAHQLYLNEHQPKLSEEVIRFVLQLKQGTIWSNAQILEVVELILDKVQPTRIAERAKIRVNGQEYHLSPAERSVGAVTMVYPSAEEQLSLSWSGIESDYIWGGVSYLVTEPSADVTPTGEKLTIEKQLYVREVDATGQETFRLITDDAPAEKGDQIIVRYLLEAKQDLSLVVIIDPRPAASEFGYDFEGYGRSDRLWWSYSRRDSEDRLYIDYLPRGRHVLEIEAVASNSGSYTYGPAQIQSYYASEYVGNSSGGTLQVVR